MYKDDSSILFFQDVERGDCMGYVTGTDSRQMALGVWSVEDEVPRDSPARFIEVFVGSLDLEGMGFEHTVPAPTGRPPYNPYDLVKLYVWGYLNRIRSSGGSCGSAGGTSSCGSC